ncbi:MAG: hypothetical protein ACOC2U_04580, partial [bacterium]
NYLVYKQVNPKSGKNDYNCRAYKKVNNEPDEEYFHINHSHLKSVINSKTDKYIKYLRNGEFIIHDQKYIKGKKSYHYKLNPKFVFDLNTIPVEPGTKLFEMLQKKHRNKRAHFNRLEPHLKTMKDEFMNIQFEYDAAKNYIAEISNIKKRIAYFNQIEALADKRLRYFTRNKTNNRLYTNVTNLKKELREFIVGDYTHIDLKNSQPFFLSQLLFHLNEIAAKIDLRDIKGKNRKERDTKNNTILCCSLLKFNPIKTFGIKAIKSISLIHQKQKKSNMVNLKEFADCVNNGRMYEYIGESFDGKFTRDEIKEMMFAVLFSRNIEYDNKNVIFIPYENEKKVFAEVFPIVARIVKILKDGNYRFNKYKILPVSLQKIESYIFIDCIAKDLVNAGIVPLTIHDSVIVETKHTQQALKIIHSVFLEHFGVIPALHVNEMNTILT